MSSTAEPQQQNIAGRSVGELIGELTSDLSTLLRQEVALAKAEVTESASKAGKGAGMLAGSGVAAQLGLVFASVTVMWALGKAMDLVWASLIVTVLWFVAAAVLALSGRAQLKQVSVKPEQTIETLKEDAQWVRTRNS